MYINRVKILDTPNGTESNLAGHDLNNRDILSVKNHAVNRDRRRSRVPAPQTVRLHYDATGSRYNLQGKFRADGGTSGEQLRRYTTPEDPRNNLGPSTTGESLANHVHARLIPELHRVD